MDAEFTLAEIGMRLGFALVAGVLLGLERESKGRAAGLKTTILVCMAAAIGMLLSEAWYQRSFQVLSANSGWRPDPARLAAGILAGMGFIGGGVIIQQGNTVRGVTTASVLWFVTIIGLCFGSGHLKLGALATGIALATLFLLPLIEKVIPNDRYGSLSVSTTTDGPSMEQLRKLLKEAHFKVTAVAWNIDMPTKRVILDFALKYKEPNSYDLQQQLISKLSAVPGVAQASWKA